MFVWDDTKNDANKAKHGLTFDAAYDFDWDNAFITPDDRMDYGERRQRAFGLLYGKLHALIFTHRGDDIRIISLRRANKREERLYDSHK